MRVPRSSRRILPGSAVSLLPALAVLLVVGLLLAVSTPSSPVHQAGKGAWIHPDTFGNGMVQTVLSPSAPAMTVAAQGQAGSYGLYAGLGGLEEVSSVGGVLATADLASTHWTVRDSSGPAGLSMSYNASVPVIPRHGVAGAPAKVIVLMVNPAGPQAPAAGASAVTMTITVNNWPWIHPVDSLTLLLPIWPNDTTSEHLAEGGTNTMNCVGNDSQQAQEFFTWGGQVIAVDPKGTDVTLATAASVTGSPQNSTVAVVLPGSSAGYAQYQYAVHLGILFTPPVASVPMVDGLVGVGIGGLVLLALVAGIRRTWSRPPSLGPLVE